MSYPHSGESAGPVQKHDGHTIEAWLYGPDYLCLVDGAQLPNFYETAAAASRAGMRYIDQLRKDKD